MPSPIIARADALMRRQHQTGHSNTPVEEIPVLTDALESDDIPTLLDIDTPPPPPAISQPPAPESPPPPETPPPTFEPMLAELSERLQARLQAELPRLIEATLRDYLAEQALSRRQRQSRD